MGRDEYASVAQQWANEYKIGLTPAEVQYYDAMLVFPEEYGPGKIACVGAGIGSDIHNTTELKPMKFHDAMSGEDAAEWQQSGYTDTPRAPLSLYLGSGRRRAN